MFRAYGVHYVKEIEAIERVQQKVTTNLLRKIELTGLVLSIIFFVGNCNDFLEAIS